MAKSKPTSKTPTSNSNPNYRGFVNVVLTQEEKAEIKEAHTDPVRFWQTLDGYIDDGFKFTFSYDDYSRCWQVVGQRSDKDHVDYGLLMSGRGSSALKAFKQWCYIQGRKVGDSTWTEFSGTSSQFEIDD